LARVLVFDSGLGGLSVYRAINHVMRPLDITYVADFKNFPYGDWDEEKLADHLLKFVGELIHGLSPEIVVIACNTASTLVLNDLRMAYPNMLFVGTVPAIKPAANATRSHMFSVLATPGTAKRTYTTELIDTFAHSSQVKVVATPNLAPLAEERMQGRAIDIEAVKAQIAPAFVEEGDQRTDTIVLGCTHYPLILKDLRAAAPWDVAWIDPAPAIAKRLYSLLEGRIEGGGVRHAYHTNPFTTYGQEKIFKMFGFEWLRSLNPENDMLEI